MIGVCVTPYSIAMRFLGVREVPGSDSNPAVLAMLQLDNQWPEGDDVPWCSALPNLVCHLLEIERTRSLRARSWLLVGREISLDDAEPGFDVVILNRGGSPDPSVIEDVGHVGFFAGRSPDGSQVRILGGNQADSVNISSYPAEQILGVRRLLP